MFRGPWQRADGTMMPPAGYLPRVADALLTDRLGAVGAVVIEGLKGCGKTETARQLAGSEVLLDVDVEAARAAALDPRLVLNGPTPRLLDEWQREPLVWDAVRRAVDERRQPGQFILTGSATPRDDVVRHSGAGRISVLRMRTMTLFEQGVSQGVGISLAALLSGDDPGPARCELDLQAYSELVVTGGWPQLVGADIATAMQFVRDYLETIIEHDIDTVTGAHRDPRLVRRFLHAYAQLTAHPARVATIIARARGDSDDESGSGAPSRWTAQPYLDGLRRMMIVDEVEAWDPALRSRLRLTGGEKRHLGDPSLAAALMGCSPRRLLSDLNTLGFLFEALVTRDLRVHAEALGASIFHYREQSGRLEVDLVVEQTDGSWAGFEVKLGGGAVDDAAAALRRLANKVVTPPAALAVVTAGEYGYRRQDGVWVVPLGCLSP